MPLLIEDATCPEIEASGIARIERLTGGRICVVLYAERHGHVRAAERSEGPARALLK